MTIPPGAYTGLKHSHTLFAIIFVLSFLIKTVLLFMGKNEQLDKFRKRTRVILDMILPTLLIALGSIMGMSAGWPHILYVKLILLILSIPMGIVAMRRKNKMLAVATCIVLLSIIVIAYTKMLWV